MKQSEVISGPVLDGAAPESRIAVGSRGPAGSALRRAQSDRASIRLSGLPGVRPDHYPLPARRTVSARAFNTRLPPALVIPTKACLMRCIKQRRGFEGLILYAHSEHTALGMCLAVRGIQSDSRREINVSGGKGGSEQTTTGTRQSVAPIWVVSKLTRLP